MPKEIVHFVFIVIVSKVEIKKNTELNLYLKL